MLRNPDVRSAAVQALAVTVLLTLGLHTLDDGRREVLTGHALILVLALWTVPLAAAPRMMGSAPPLGSLLASRNAQRCATFLAAGLFSAVGGALGILLTSTSGTVPTPIELIGIEIFVTAVAVAVVSLWGARPTAEVSESVMVAITYVATVLSGQVLGAATGNSPSRVAAVMATVGAVCWIAVLHPKFGSKGVLG
jgi:hypothetical protein